MAFNQSQIEFMKNIGIPVDFSMPLSGKDYETIEEMASLHLQKHGFDKNYMPTEEGKLCEAILDVAGAYTRPDGEYDRPLPKRIENPTKEDQERLQQLIEKYTKDSGGDECHDTTRLILDDES